MIAAYREVDRTQRRQVMQTLFDSLRHGVPAALTELLTNYIARSLLETGGFRPRLHP